MPLKQRMTNVYRFIESSEVAGDEVSAAHLAMRLVKDKSRLFGRYGPVDYWNPDVIVRLKRNKQPTDVIETNGGWNPIVSTRLKELVQSLDPTCCQFLPCTMWQRGKPVGRCWVMCPLVVADVVNLSAIEKYVHLRYKRSAFNRLLGQPIVDRSRVHTTAPLFLPKYAIGQYLLCTSTFRSKCKAAGMTGIKWDYVPFKDNEKPAQRKRLECKRGPRERWPAARARDDAFKTLPLDELYQRGNVKRPQTKEPTATALAFLGLRSPGQLRSARIGEGVSEGRVTQAERALGVKFPADYRKFLTTCGWLDGSGAELSGLGDGHLIIDVDELTKQWRDSPQPIAHDRIVVGVDGRGGYYWIKSGDTKCVVMYWDHELEEDEVASPTLVTWLRKQIRG
jgi:hypothetical protein